MTSFLISIVKFYRVCLKIFSSTEKNYVIYDGPGYTFNILKINSQKSSVTASTFQGLVQFLLNYLFVWNRRPLFDFAYVRDLENLKMIDTDSADIIQIPFVNYFSNVTNYYLVGKLSTSLNLSSYLVSSGSKSLSISGCDSSCSWVLVHALGLIVKEEFKSVMLGRG